MTGMALSTSFDKVTTTLVPDDLAPWTSPAQLPVWPSI